MVAARREVHPRVRVVTLNYDGGDLTLACIDALRSTEWPDDGLELVLVDNASRDGIADAVESRWPEVRVVRSPDNRGFAGGMNLGLGDLDDVDHVAVVNNDVVVTPGWLDPLVRAIEAGSDVGAACPKILFASHFAEIELAVPTTRRGRGDRRPLGAWVGGARVDGVDVTARLQLVAGFWGPEPGAGSDAPLGGEWTDERARLRVPVPVSGAGTVELLLHADTPRAASAGRGEERRPLAITDVPTWLPVPTGPPVEVVNSAGTRLEPGGFGADRGFLEVDDGRYDEPADVFGWSGATALLSRRYVDDVGGFDERLFLYYEDLELSWRGRERGWRTRYVPESVVRHVHSATIGSHSSLARYQNERNRLLVLARHGSVGDAAGAAARSLLVTASYARRDVVARLLRGRRPRPQIVDDRLRAFGGYVRRLPGMVRARRRDADGRVTAVPDPRGR